MWECSQANPQLLFDVGLEIAASWQRLLTGVCVQQGQTFPNVSLQKPPYSDQTLWISTCSRISVQNGVEASYRGVLWDVCKPHTDLSPHLVL